MMGDTQDGDIRTQKGREKPGKQLWSYIHGPIFLHYTTNGQKNHLFEIRHRRTRAFPFTLAWPVELAEAQGTG